MNISDKVANQLSKTPMAYEAKQYTKPKKKDYTKLKKKDS